ncbi:VWFA-related domain-containing protein [Bryocella elongata]|uniref:VWFA-related domain-containing protein n=1 Tax=Bryocella elongata TaxID=863522 RepID=A0A1H6CKN4_9BACT|nr:VWA domain-containing protein [Bryocella elongata]SEG72996.1 VWFA-related domain-containing protein [Bryocella elongata]
MRRYYWPGPTNVIHVGRVTLPTLLSFLLVVSITARAQDDAQVPHAPTLTVTSRLVVLDVVATGKDGKPVEGLTRADFRVLEDGQPQEIRSFEATTMHTLPATSAEPGTIFDPGNPASFGQSPAAVLVLDQLNTHFADSSFARRELHDYLAGQPALLPQPTTLLTVYDSHFQQIAPFTRSRDQLLKALAAAPTRYAWKLEQGGNSDVDSGPVDRLQQSLNALEQIAQSYERIPGRKNLVWVGGGFPTLNPTTLDGDDAREVKDTLDHVTDVLLDTRVTLYAVDPSSTAAGETEITSADQADFAMAAGGLSEGIQPFSSTADFDRLGAVTGGRVVRGLNNVSQQIASSVQQGDDFYTLAYSPTRQDDTPGAYRKITVQCLRPGVTVSTRQGYFPAPAVSAATARTDFSYDLSAAAESAVPLHAVRLTVSAAAGTGAYMLEVPATDLTWTANPDGSSTAHVAALAVLLSGKDAALGHMLRTMTATAKPGTDLRNPDRKAEFALAVPLTGKTKKLRFVVRDATTGHMGSADVQVEGR